MVKFWLENRRNLLTLPFTGRRSELFHPINHTEDLKLKLHYNSHKTYCLEGNNVMVRSLHKRIDL